MRETQEPVKKYYLFFSRNRQSKNTLLEVINRKVDQIMLDLSALSEAVGAQTSVVESVVTLLDQIAEELEAAQGDPAAVAAAVEAIRANSETLAAEVTKNTPTE